MPVWWVCGAVALIAFVGLVASSGSIWAQAQVNDDLAALRAEVSRLYNEGKFADAMPIAERYVASARQKHGEEHAEFATAISWLAYVYQARGRYTEAEPLYKRALAVAEKALGPDHPGVGTMLNNLAGVYWLQGSYGAAEPLLQRSLAIREKALGPDHPNVGTGLNNLAELYRLQGRNGEAEKLSRRALSILEKALGPDHPDVAAALSVLAGLCSVQGRNEEAEPLSRRALSILEKALGPDHPLTGKALNNLATLYEVQGRISEAEPLYMRSLAIREKALGHDHPDVGTGLNNLAELYRLQGRYAEAEPLFKRSLTIREKALGPDHPGVGITLNMLAALYQAQGRYGEAEQLYRRSLAIREKALGPDHPDVGTALNNLAELYRVQGRYDEAEALYSRALAIDEKALGTDNPDVGTDLNNLALLYEAQGRIGEAEALYRRSLAVREKALGPNHPDVGTSLNNLAWVYLARRRYAEAGLLLRRALAIDEKTLGPDHPDVGRDINSLAWLAVAQHDWTQAAEQWRRSTAIIERRVLRGLGEPSARREAQRLSWQFTGLVKVVDRLALETPSERARFGHEMFETAQWALSSEAAAALAQMGLRSASGAPELAALVRQRQDLSAEWQLKDKQLIVAKSEPPAKRNAATEQALSDRLTAIEARFVAIDARLRKDFPDYAALSSPKPISVTDVQANLHPDEALVLFLDTDDRFKPLPEETLVWAVTKTEMRWVKSELGSKVLTELVVALRCGLDAALWDDEAAAARCRALGKGAPERDAFGNIRAETLPFDTDRAYTLYKALFSPIEELIKGKHLLIVPSGALTQLPFQVLMTERPDPAMGGTEALRRAAWLVRSHGLTVLPSVSALKALRELAKESHASRTLIGFGNPLLDGPDARYQALATTARSKASCPELAKERVAALTGQGRGVLPLSLRSGLADAGEIRSQMPLPETADELCAVARDLGASDKDVWLGNRATETEIKRLSEAGELAKYHTIHFATHGALAGQVAGNTEPGLILTPPTTATERDDGYLSASEIAQLKLDADWVILSACNTAAGGAEGAEALSGLARAFFYAGARALLVSHWAVASDATVKLITGAVGRMASDKSIGRAEAMRQSMLTLVDNGETYEAHPAFWAPFIVVGEGATK
jgi:CHAT domain-containing protein/tetratricopeptide (TPR) repeat protein